MILINKYEELKEKKIITLEKKDDGFIAKQKIFNKLTGEENGIEETAILESEIIRQKQILEKAVEGINILLQDLVKLKI